MMGNHKKGICMAEGGITETPDQLMERMAKKYGMPAAGEKGVTPAQAHQAPVQQAQPKPQQSTGLGIMGILKGRKEAIDKATSYAKGGILEQPNGGIVSGPGTPTSDDVPVTIRGGDYNLSDTEAVLPSKTRQALGELLGAEPGNAEQANKLVEQFIQQTNGKPPVKVGKGANLAAGGILDADTDLDYKAIQAAKIGQQAKPAVNYGDNSTAGLNSRLATMQAANGGAESATAPMNNAAQSAALNAALPKPAEPAAAPVNPMINAARPWYAGTPSTETRTGLEMERERRGQAAQAGVLNDPVKSAIQYGVVGQGGSPAPAVQPKPVQSAVPATIPTAAPSNPLMTPPTDVQPKAAPVQAVGRDESGVITADSAMAANLNPMARSGGISGSIDMAGVNGIMARENKARGEMIDSMIKANGGNGIGILGVDANGMTQIDRDNAEKTARWRQDDLLAKAGRNPAAGQVAVASANGQNQIEAERMRQQSEAGRNQIAMRGQDLAAQSQAAQLAGNPLDNELKKAKTQGILAENGSAAMLAEIQKKAVAGDAQAMATYRALTGKDANKERYAAHVVGGGVNEMGQAQPQYLGVTGPDGTVKFHRPDQQGQQAKPSYDQFSAQMKARFPGQVDDAQLKQAYAKQYGA